MYIHRIKSHVGLYHLRTWRSKMWPLRRETWVEKAFSSSSSYSSLSFSPFSSSCTPSLSPSLSQTPIYCTYPHVYTFQSVRLALFIHRPSVITLLFHFLLYNSFVLRYVWMRSWEQAHWSRPAKRRELTIKWLRDGISTIVCRWGHKPQFSLICLVHCTYTMLQLPMYKVTFNFSYLTGKFRARERGVDG